MIAFFILMVGVIALSAVAGYAVFSATQSSTTLSMAQRNAAAMDLAASMMHEAILLLEDGTFHAPMGEEGVNDYTVLPQWVAGGARTPWGVEYGWCPYAPITGPMTGAVSANVIHGGGEYSVATINVALGGRDRAYVVSGARPVHDQDDATLPSGVLGFIVSPSINSTAMPSCEDIAYQSGTFLVRGNVNGTVRAITEGVLRGSGLAGGRGVMVLDRHVAPDGEGQGVHSGEPASLELVAAQFVSFRPQRMTIRLQAGEYDVDELDFGSFDGESWGRLLRIVGAGKGNDGTRLIAKDPGTWLRLPVDTVLSGVSLSGGLGIEMAPTARLHVLDATTQTIVTKGGRLVLGDEAAVTSHASLGTGAIRIEDGDLLTRAGTSMSWPGIDATAAGGAALQLKGSMARIGGRLTVLTDAAPLAELDQSGITHSGDPALVSFNGSPADEDDFMRVDHRLVGAGKIEAAEIETEAISLGISVETNNCNQPVCNVTCPAPKKALSAICTASQGRLNNSFYSNGRATFNCVFGDSGGSPSVTATAVCAAIE